MTTRTKLIITRYVFWFIFMVLLFATSRHTIAALIVFAVSAPVFIYLDKKIGWWKKA